MLDHEDGIAQVAQPFQGIDKPGIIGGMQADRRFVADIEHTHQAAADLGGQADALGFAAGQGGGGAVERKIIQPHIPEEAQPGGNFLDIWWAIRISRGDNTGLLSAEREAIHCKDWVTDMAVMSMIFLPPMVTARASGLSRLPSTDRAGLVDHVLFVFSLESWDSVSWYSRCMGG